MAVLKIGSWGCMDDFDNFRTVREAWRIQGDRCDD